MDVQVVQVACGMHHTLALAQPRAQTQAVAAPGSPEFSNLPHPPQQSFTVADSASIPYKVFAFGQNGKGQCGVPASKDQTAAKRVIWEPAVAVISQQQSVKEVIS